MNWGIVIDLVIAFAVVTALRWFYRRWRKYTDD